MFCHVDWILGLLIGVVSLNAHLAACSRIFWDNKVNMVAARTMDLYFNERPTLVVLPRGIEREGKADDNSIKWKSKYGSVIVTAFDGKAVSEGMNEKGLSGHLLYLHGTEYEPRDQRPGLSNTIWIQYILDNFSSVSEAVDSLNQFQVVATVLGDRQWPLHACLEDATGDSAIIEYIKGKMVIHHGPEYTVMTNEPPYDIQVNNLKRYRYFGGDLPLPGDIDSESRFVRCSAFLKTLPEPKNLEEAIGHAFGVIRTVQVPFGAEDTSTSLSNSVSEDTWPTRWVSATDVTNLTYYFNSTSTPNIVWIDFYQLDFSPYQSAKSVNLHDPSLVGEISHRFKNGKRSNGKRFG